MRLDYLGNTVINICLESPHSELDILADSEVALHPPICVMPDQTPAWEQIRDTIRQYKNAKDLETFEFVFAFPMIQPNKLPWPGAGITGMSPRSGARCLAAATTFSRWRWMCCSRLRK
jgi:hypothetical protein